LKWLSENGFQAPAHVEPVIADYLSRDWLFVAAKLSDIADAETPKAPHPLSLRFVAAEPVYPMALTTVDNTSLTVDLFVFANGTANAPGWDVQLSLPTERVDDGDSLGWRTPIRRTTSPVPVSHPGLKELVGATSWATHLRGSFEAGQAVPDAVITIGHSATRVPLRLSQQAVAGIAVDIGLGLAVVSLIVLLVLKNYHDWNRQRAGRGVLLILGSATLLSSMLVLTVPSEQISSSAYDRGSDLREAIHACDWVGALLKEELARQPDQAISAADVRELAEHKVQSVSLDLGLTATPVHRDSAGNYTITEDPGGAIVFRTYDSIGGVCSEVQVWPVVAQASEDRRGSGMNSSTP
ncbi:MAG: DUF2330 domain-containing protein, partial [Salinibacterium sp.]|nr:DUF2330 domain-containing protein [Salinibacterium sp.]